MKFSTDKAHRNYFYKNGTIEFDDLLSKAQVGELNSLVDQILCQKLSIRQNQLFKQTPNDLFLQGHNLFKQNDSLKKLLLQRRFAEIAAELMEVHFLRMGYDQLLVGESKPPLIETPYDLFLYREGTLQEKSCITPVVCGLILCLEPSQSPETSTFFPKTSGSGVFLKPDIPLQLNVLRETEGGRYILIAFADFRTVYILNEKDPHTHVLKHEGLVFGDRLPDKLHPILYR